MAGTATARRHASAVDEGDLIRRIVAGDFVDPATGRVLRSPIRAIRIAPSLDGGEADLLAEAGIKGRLALIADADTWAALGRRVAFRLQYGRRVDVVVVRRPQADEANVRDLGQRVAAADALVAVGSGTINDLTKAVAARTGRDYAVFASALSMNGYATNSVSLLTDKGMKTTLPARAPAGVFLDLAVAAAAPLRLTRSGLGDSICRTTVQVDGLLSHRLFGTPYSETPFMLQSDDESEMLAMADGYESGDLGAYAALARVLVLTGIGALICGSSRSGSMSEHLVSHAVDMLAGAEHPGSLHGEQVGIATLAMARLQAAVFAAPQPPDVRATAVFEARIRRCFAASADACCGEFGAKALDQSAAARVRDRLGEQWSTLAPLLRGRMRSLTQLDGALRAAGAARTPADIALPSAIWKSALRHARFIRNRYTVLDLADDAGLLEPFVAGCH